MDRYDFIERLRPTLPVFFPLASVDKLCGGTIARGTIYNALSAGKGPDGVFYHGRKVMLSRDEFLAWLASRLTFPDETKK